MKTTATGAAQMMCFILNLANKLFRCLLLHGDPVLCAQQGTLVPGAGAVRQGCLAPSTLAGLSATAG